MFIPPPGFTTPTVGPSCATHLLSCLEQSNLVVPGTLSGSISYTCRHAHMQVEDLLEMIACLRVFKLPNFEAWGELALGVWWHISPYVAYKKLMLQVCFHARDHFYICDRFAHGPMEKDEVCLHGYVSRLVCDEMVVTFFETCYQEAGQMLGHTLGFSHPQHLVLACHTPSHHALPCIQCLHGLHGCSNLHMGSEILILGSWQSQHAADQRVIKIRES